MGNSESLSDIPNRHEISANFSQPELMQLEANFKEAAGKHQVVHEGEQLAQSKNHLTLRQFHCFFRHVLTPDLSTHFFFLGCAGQGYDIESNFVVSDVVTKDGERIAASASASSSSASSTPVLVSCYHMFDSESLSESDSDTEGDTLHSKGAKHSRECAHPVLVAKELFLEPKPKSETYYEHDHVARSLGQITAPLPTMDFDHWLGLIYYMCRCDDHQRALMLWLAFLKPNRRSLHSSELRTMITIIVYSARKLLDLELVYKAAPEVIPSLEDVHLRISNYIELSIAHESNPAKYRERDRICFLRFKEMTLENRQFIDYLLFAFRFAYTPPHHTPKLPTSLEFKAHLHPPTLLENIRPPKKILTPTFATELRKWIPRIYHNCDFVQSFNSTWHGSDLSTCLFMIQHISPHLVPTVAILLIQDSHGAIFGVFASGPLRAHSTPHYYGDHSTFLFTLSPTLAHYPATYRDQNFIYTDHEGNIGFGGLPGSFGLFVDAQLKSGCMHPCATFENPNSVKFHCHVVESWFLLQPEKRNAYQKFLLEHPIFEHHLDVLQDEDFKP